MSFLWRRIDRISVWHSGLGELVHLVLSSLSLPLTAVCVRLIPAINPCWVALTHSGWWGLLQTRMTAHCLFFIYSFLCRSLEKDPLRSSLNVCVNVYSLGRCVMTQFFTVFPAPHLWNSKLHYVNSSGCSGNNVYTSTSLTMQINNIS